MVTDSPILRWTGFDTTPDWLDTAMILSLTLLAITIGSISRLFMDNGLPTVGHFCKSFGLVSVAFALRWGRTFYLLRCRARENTYVTVGKTIGFLAVLPFRFIGTGIYGICYDVLRILNSFRRRQ